MRSLLPRSPTPGSEDRFSLAGKVRSATCALLMSLLGARAEIMRAANANNRRRLWQTRTPRSETVLLDFFRDHLLDALDVLSLLPFQVAPQLLQLGLSVGIGDVLIVSPDGGEAVGEVVDQVVVVILTAATFADVLQFLLCCQCHGHSPCLLREMSNFKRELLCLGRLSLAGSCQGRAV